MYQWMYLIQSRRKRSSVHSTIHPWVATQTGSLILTIWDAWAHMVKRYSTSSLSFPPASSRPYRYYSKEHVQTSTPQCCVHLPENKRMPWNNQSQYLTHLLISRHTFIQIMFHMYDRSQIIAPSPDRIVDHEKDEYGRPYHAAPVHILRIRIWREWEELKYPDYCEET